MSKPKTKSLLRRVHEDERGAISLETILIIGAIALPILIWLLKDGWPRIQEMFTRRIDELDDGQQTMP